MIVDTSRARRIAALLTNRGERLAVAESSAGGLISAALVSVPGSSAFYLGGMVVYTLRGREAQLGATREIVAGRRSATVEMAELSAELIRVRFAADWGLAETGATGPDPNGYGDAPGHGCFAVAGPRPRSRLLETASDDRLANMVAFTDAALELLEEALV